MQFWFFAVNSEFLETEVLQRTAVDGLLVWRLHQWYQGRNSKLTVIGVLFFEIVLWFHPADRQE